MSALQTNRVAIVGAGAGGLACAIALASRGIDVTVIEKERAPGGKMRQIAIGDARIDSGPTVFTMRWVFDELFADAGLSFADEVALEPLEVLARHAWDETTQFDLFADHERSVDAIGKLSGAAEAKRYREFCADSKAIYDLLEGPFMRNAQPSMGALVAANGVRNMTRIKPFQSMWSALGKYFHDPRLRRLFGRYATYCGSSPFDAPATLMLVAHVEREGVWSVNGGMAGLAQALARCATKLGVTLRYGEDVTQVLTNANGACGVTLASGERIAADALVMNCDVSALASGLFGKNVANAAPVISQQHRSLSAMTWSLTAQTHGFPLHRHNVFFSRDYRAEFDAIFRHNAMPEEPTVYVCAQDRSDDGAATGKDERLFVLINAPATGERTPFDAAETERCARAAFGVLARCGLTVDRNEASTAATTPSDFNRLFPATGGALYGRSSHGWMASFQRPGARTKIPNLYLAGGSTHPGPGVPMAALSGRTAAQSLLADLASISRSSQTATHGGMSMR